MSLQNSRGSIVMNLMLLSKGQMNKITPICLLGISVSKKKEMWDIIFFLTVGIFVFPKKLLEKAKINRVCSFFKEKKINYD